MAVTFEADSSGANVSHTLRLSRTELKGLGLCSFRVQGLVFSKTLYTILPSMCMYIYTHIHFTFNAEQAGVLKSGSSRSSAPEVSRGPGKTGALIIRIVNRVWGVYYTI